ncbi:hypothetical protein E3T26_04460 [Cryobacterium sp. TMT1-21]|uniref:Uncharacterized protein n=1 Tax=Cryobacterium shii TaxID=1259235 RepID=A0AAQ2HGY8_9MICO|nr:MULTISPECIES: hypothetical protein [Cryobacterium]TFC52574.1 hypothetical protein E3O49_01165 [Cryobacterium shii]TFC82355.1 hypothetical protein E3T24_13480 [Cryobacterium sp. TmT2-59]TFD13932.1 hypothetical protein E3T42_12695 [Cryobacterium sp. TMT4-10]TFD16357.1 hypothetical protein E3T26_04460 [Cryobacterium sp. TMT1-21]TFD27947.1 hypothetical protein E3T32_01385 [Cryobacterium sp. TMT2-23]
MKRIFHPGGSVLTGSELADAVMHYAEALSSRGQVDVIDIPVADETGLPGRAQFLIGASSQLVCVTADAVDQELVESAKSDDLRRKALSGTASGRVSWTGDGLDSPQFDEFEY